MDGFLLVDDRDGRVLLEVTDPVTAFRLFDKLQADEPQLAETLSLVRFDARQGSIVASETTTRVRSLT